MPNLETKRSRLARRLGVPETEGWGFDDLYSHLVAEGWEIVAFTCRYPVGRVRISGAQYEGEMLMDRRDGIGDTPAEAMVDLLDKIFRS